MKVFAIQTTNNVPQFKQTNSTNQTPIMKTNLSQDKFVSKTNFGMATLIELEETLAGLEKKLETGKLSKQAREALKDQIDRLKIKIERRTPSDGESYGGPAAHGADHPFD